MSKFISGLAALFLFLFCSCSNDAWEGERSNDPRALIDTGLVPQFEDARQMSYAGALGDCTRGRPKPIIKKTIYPDTEFHLNEDSLTATEIVKMHNGDRLTITNAGCEYVTLKFRFETTRFAYDTTNHEFWFRAGSELMKETLAGLDAPIDLERGVGALDHFIEADKQNDFKNLSYNKDIDYGINEIRNIVNVESVEKLNDDKAAFTISFSVGPL